MAILDDIKYYNEQIKLNTNSPREIERYANKISELLEEANAHRRPLIPESQKIFHDINYMRYVLLDRLSVGVDLQKCMHGIIDNLQNVQHCVTLH